MRVCQRRRQALRPCLMLWFPFSCARNKLPCVAAHFQIQINFYRKFVPVGQQLRRTLCCLRAGLPLRGSGPDSVWQKIRGPRCAHVMVPFFPRARKKKGTITWAQDREVTSNMGTAARALVAGGTLAHSKFEIESRAHCDVVSYPTCCP